MDNTRGMAYKDKREAHGLGKRSGERTSGHGSGLGATLAHDCC